MSSPRRSRRAAQAPALLRATTPSWFPPGHLQALRTHRRASCPAPILLPLHHPTDPGGLLLAPPKKCWAPKFLIIQPESVRRGLAPRTRLPTIQELCDLGWQAEQAPRCSDGLLQAAQHRTPKHPGIHISAAGRDKRRVALVPKPCLAAGAKKPLRGSSSSPPAEAQGLGSQLPKTRTPSDMAPGTMPPKRVARRPPMQSSQQPVPPEEAGDKVPAVTRQRFLSLFLDQCLKSCPSTQEAIEKALQEEKTAYHQSPSKTKYHELALSTLHRLCRLAPRPGPGPCKTLSAVPQDVGLGGMVATQVCFSLQHPDSPLGEDPVKGAALYLRLKELLLTQAQLKELGFPFPHPERPGGAVLFTNQDKPPADPSCRLCCRCGTQYPRGALGPLCAAGGMSLPLGAAAPHSSAQGLADPVHLLLGRHRLPWLPGGPAARAGRPPRGPAGLRAHLCQRPAPRRSPRHLRPGLRDVLHHRRPGAGPRLRGGQRRQGGVRPLRQAPAPQHQVLRSDPGSPGPHTVSLQDVQAILLALFNANTILIGHSLHSDLLALKLTHCTVLDTSVLFPHHLGLPYRRSLRSLAAQHLGRVIQDGVHGHNSIEDAISCMHLVISKVGQDTQTQRSPPPRI
uniref:Exonuclease domain-containing protein n=1 Tax=Pipistrellus kuhlii TaxID=59472 RepID=A0A7J7TKR6_PIPKU|nr:hypothetical protein mPipKuh1_009335 [Pipistrellus kuhlii]